MRKVIDQCDATFNGLRCEQDKNHHRKSFGILKHNYQGQQWTDKGAQRDQESKATTKL
jgi:hypothetical protein